MANPALASSAARPDLIRSASARSILSPTSGFIAQAGFSHSLTPARNCTYGCLYCYVPTLRIYGGLKPEDWKRWGQFTTYKQNAPELLTRQLRPDQRIYCSPLTDPYQPVEAEVAMMPRLLRALAQNPPRVFVIQTRGPLIVRDLELLSKLAERTTLRVSFSVTTNRDEIRRIYEPRCEPIAERLDAMRQLRDAGLTVHPALAPVLPCDPEALADLALEASNGAVIADPFHVRSVKRTGAVTRETAERISAKHGFEQWHEPPHQAEVIERIRRQVAAGGRVFGVGPAGFALLAAEA